MNSREGGNEGLLNKVKILTNKSETSWGQRHFLTLWGKILFIYPALGMPLATHDEWHELILEFQPNRDPPWHTAIFCFP